MHIISVLKRLKQKNSLAYRVSSRSARVKSKTSHHKKTNQNKTGWVYGGTPFYNHSTQEDFFEFQASLVYIVLASHNYIMRPCLKETKAGEVVP